MKALRPALVLATVLVAGCGQTATPSLPADAAPATSDVQIVAGEQPLDPAALVFSTATILDPSYHDASGKALRFQTSVVNTAGAKYVGYALAVQKQADGTFAAAGKIQAFLARYGQTVTADWTNSGVTPSHPNFLTTDLQEVATSPAQVTLPAAAAHAGQLRLYRSRVRTGYAPAGYTYQEGLLVFAVSPKDGKRTSFLYSANAPTAGFYRLASGAVPAAQAAASLVDVVHAADSMLAIKPGSPEHFQVPLHSYVAESYRVVGTQSFRGQPNPFGPPLTLTAAQAQALAAVWTACQGTGPSAAQVDDLFALAESLAL